MLWRYASRQQPDQLRSFLLQPYPPEHDFRIFILAYIYVQTEEAAFWNGFS